MSTRSRNNRIVFLDSGTIDCGDISFRDIQKTGSYKAFKSTRPSQILSRIRGADMVITNKCGFDRKLLAKAKSVRCIHVAATGVNNVDLKAAREYGIAVTNVTGYSTETVAQFTLSFILALAGNLTQYDKACHEGKWSRSPFFTWTGFPVQEVAGKTLGIVGYGAIGRRVAALAKAFRMKVLIARIPGRSYIGETEKNRKPFHQVLRQADFLTLHAPLSDLTHNLIHEGNIRKMKKGSFLINMARGGIVHEEALYRALKRGHLAGAACDVLTQEPPPISHRLLKAPDLLMTPHIAWASLEARQRLLREIGFNIRAVQSGKNETGLFNFSERNIL